MTSGNDESVRRAMENAVGAEYASVDTGKFAIHDRSPDLVVSPGQIDELGQVMAAAWDANAALAPWGGGTLIDIGGVIERLDVVIGLSRLNRVVEHNPADLTVTVEAGITLANLHSTLIEQGQILALDAPLPDRATIGGTLATGVSGPLKLQFGSPRDLVIGMKVVQADGRVTKSGGQVVKNVSGYDMTRLHIGGLGTLGVIAEVSLKLTPLPRVDSTLVAAFETSDKCLNAALGIFRSKVVPLALTCFDGEADQRADILGLEGGHFLAVRLGGRPLTAERQVRDCDSICRELGSTAVDTLDTSASVKVWRKLADFGWDDPTRPAVAGRASLVPTKVPEVIDRVHALREDTPLRPAIISHPGHGTALIHWFVDPYEAGDDTTVDALSKTLNVVHEAGGQMIIEQCPSELKPRFDVWDDVGESVAIMQRMKEQYDPKRILNPGRYAGGI